MAKVYRSKTHTRFDGDKPLADRNLDRLDRTRFATGVADCIVTLPPGECFVLGLDGPWGGGKTTVLNFIEQELKSRSGLSVVWFNPWRIRNEDDLLIEFFHVLATGLKTSLKTRSQKAVGEVLKYASFLRPAAGLAPEVVGRTFDSAKELGDRFKIPTIEQQRSRLVAALEKAATKTVVFIDDIDRLDPGEIELLFRIVKACADLPNLVYVLAFDHMRVAGALAGSLAIGDPEHGRSYLEKIVQIHLTLPRPKPEALEDLCKERIAGLLDLVGIPFRGTEAQEWDQAFARGVGPRIRTPRHVHRYLNAVRFAVPMLKGEVHVGDQLLVEALRVFYPGAYETIRQRLREFLGLDIVTHSVRNLEERGLLAAETDSMDERSAAALEHLVQGLFPLYESAAKGLRVTTSSAPVWASTKRVCSPEYADRYFAYAIDRADVSETDIAGILRAADQGNWPRLRSLLRAQTGVLKQSSLVDRLGRRIIEWTPEGTVRLAIALAEMSGRFPAPPALATKDHAGIEAAALAARLCRRSVEPAARLAAIVEVIEKADADWFAAAFFWNIDPPEESPLQPALDPSGLARIRAVFATRARALAGSSEPLLNTAALWRFDLLFAWARAAGRDVVSNQFVPSMRMNASIALQMLQCLVARYGPLGPDSLARLSLIVDVDAMYQAVDQSWIRDEHRKPPEERGEMSEAERLWADFWWYYNAPRRSNVERHPTSPSENAPS